jgi:AraC family transcriptional regulator
MSMCLSKRDDAPTSRSPEREAMPDIALMSKAVDFIEDNLKQAISVADMAEAVSFSLYHFCRTFNRITHHTAYDYLMRRRLSEAAGALLQSDRKILDIALDFQFNSPETFCRAFKRMFGMQPNQLRKQGCLKSQRLMPRLTLAHIQHINQGPYLKPVLEEKDAFVVAGITILVRDDKRAVSEAWDWFAQELDRGQAIAPAGNYYGIAFYPDDWEQRGYLYMAAVEVAGMEVATSPLVLKHIPALTWTRFIHKGPTRALSLTLDYIYHTWLPQSGQSPAYPWVLEGFGHDFRGADSQDFERDVYIPIR